MTTDAPTTESAQTVVLGADRSTVMPEAPARIGRYAIGQELGRGGMGVVYAATDETLRRPVAIKLLRASRGPSVTTARLRREAQALAQLSHPHVVEVYEVGEHEGHVFVAMELVEGTALDAWLQARARPWTEVLDVLIAAGRGLAAAHAKGLVHRDFKPANVIVGEDGRPRVLDFGLARHADEAAPSQEPSIPTEQGDAERPSSVLSHRLTEAGTVMGTPAYMASEQLMGQAVDARTDQYAFGVTLYEGLYGRRPYTAETFEALRKRVLAGELGPCPASAVPRRLWPVVRQALAARADDRFPSMDALLQALDRARRPSRAPWMIVGGMAVLGIAVAVVPRDPAPRCAEADAIDTVWNEARRDAIAAALLATEVPYAAHTAQQVQTWLDGFAEDWRATYRDACTAAGPHLDAQMRCLHRARQHAETTLDVLRSADADRARRAVQAVSSLPAPEDCLEVDEGPTVPPAVRDEVDAIEDVLVIARARLESGDHEGAVETADTQVARARATEHAPVIAEALVLRARSHKLAGDYARAQHDYEEAFWVAQRGSADAIAVAAGTALVFLFAAQLADLPAARTWARHARGALDRLPRPDPPQEATLLNAIGVMHDRGGDLRAAIEAYAQAAAVWGTRGPRGELPVAAAQLNHASALVELGEVDQARRLQAEALATRERRLGPAHPDLALTLADMANLELRDGHPGTALAVLERALAIHEAAMGPDHPTTARMLANLGSIQEELGDPDAAAKTYDRALQATRAAFGDDHPDVAIVRLNLGNLLLERGQARRAVAMIEQSHETMTRAWGESHPQAPLVLRDLALAHVAVGQHARALDELRRARAQLEAQRGPDLEEIAWLVWHAADALQALGRDAESQTTRAEALAICERVEGCDAASLPE